jgi:hypothetical protein
MCFVLEEATGNVITDVDNNILKNDERIVVFDVIAVDFTLFFCRQLKSWS